MSPDWTAYEYGGFLKRTEFLYAKFRNGLVSVCVPFIVKRLGCSILASR